MDGGAWRSRFCLAFDPPFQMRKPLGTVTKSRRTNMRTKTSIKHPDSLFIENRCRAAFDLLDVATVRLRSALLKRRGTDGRDGPRPWKDSCRVKDSFYS